MREMLVDGEVEDDAFGVSVAYRFPSDKFPEDGSGWEVYLPHQCGSWSITDEWEPVSRQQAITDLERFISEAQQALDALRAAPDVPAKGDTT